MSKNRRNTVEILNPLPGGAHYTSSKAARQFVRRGLAVFEAVDEAIRFLDQDRRFNRSSGMDGIGEAFWWRIGKTGGMAQQIGSIVIPAARKVKEKGRTT